MKIELPHVGESVTEGTIGKWLKQVGDPVEKYDALVEVITDKVAMEMPSPTSGTLTSILVEEGQTVPMGTPIAEIGVEGDESAISPSEIPHPGAPSVPEPEVTDTTGILLKDTAPVGPTGSGGPAFDTQDHFSNSSQIHSTSEDAPPNKPDRQRYSPVVRRLAEQHRIDLSHIAGTGMGGRLTRKDVQRHIAAMKTVEAAATSPDVAIGPNEERLPLTPVRRTIADNMVKSATQIPQAWSMVEVDATNMVRHRESVKGEFERRVGVRLTYLPFVVKIVADSLKGNPLLNSSWGGDAIILKRRINIGIAVATPTGLVVPIVHNADGLSIARLAKAIDDLTNRARQGKLTLRDVQGGTFTVNNTGGLGSIISQPLVNFPQAAILTTEAIVKRPVVANDAIAIRSMMNLCLTFDHRILDGAEASAFITGVKGHLEARHPAEGMY